MRSSALAAALAGEGWRTVCAIREETIETVPSVLEQFDRTISLVADDTGEIDEIATRVGGRCEAVVIDHYGRDWAFDRACRRIASCVTVIEDRPEALHDCDILVNQSVEPDASLPGALVGPRYALLRESFRKARARGGTGEDKGRLLLLCGITDERNVTERLFDALDGAPGVQSVDVVLGAANAHRERVQRRLQRAAVPVRLHIDPPSLAGLMSRASLAVTTAGSTCWELACLGVPMVTIVAATNQIPVARTLLQSGASEGAGSIDDDFERQLPEQVAGLLADDAKRRRMAACGRTLVDGRGVQRVARAIGTRARSCGRSPA